MIPFDSRPAPKAFTLIELVMVAAILALLVALGVPAFNHLGKASTLTTSSLQIVDQLNLARQVAISENRFVEVRFYELPDATTPATKTWHALQLFLVGNTSIKPLDKASIFARGIRLSTAETYSNLFANRSDVLVGDGESAGALLPSAGKNYRYMGFRFRPDGSTSLSSSLWVTVVDTPADVSALPPNWFAVQVDCLTGRVRTFRP